MHVRGKLQDNVLKRPRSIFGWIKVPSLLQHQTDQTVKLMRPRLTIPLQLFSLITSAANGRREAFAFCGETGQGKDSGGADWLEIEPHRHILAGSMM